MALAAAYPFIEVRIDTSGLTPVAQRAPGVIAVVGSTPGGAGGGKVAANTPTVITSSAEAVEAFASVGAGGVVGTPLQRSLEVALLQDPRPSKIYGVRVSGDEYAAALASLEGVDDVRFVGLAEETDVGAGALGALKAHVEQLSARGSARVGVAMIDPATQRGPSYVADVVADVEPLRSDTSRMAMIAARGVQGDAAIAAMAAIAGFPPHVSRVLKRVRGLRIPVEQQYGPSEISGLAEAGINPLIDPALIVGTSLHLAEGRCFTSDADIPHLDTRLELDDLDYRLKAGLIGSIGDARITKAGLTQVKMRTRGILEPLVRDAVIDDFEVRIPVLDILATPESARTDGERTLVQAARANRAVEMLVSVTYGPAVHRLMVTLAPKF